MENQEMCGYEDPSLLRHTCIATLSGSKLCGSIQIPIEIVVKSMQHQGQRP